MTLSLVKGNTEVKFFVNRDRAEKTTVVGGNANTTVATITPLEANRQMNALIRQGYTKKKASVRS